jgi:dihydrofolate reductase
MADGCETASSLEAAVAACNGTTDEVFVIGGAQIYAKALPLAQRLYLTEIRRDFPGDARFPEFERGDWRETARERHRAEEDIEFDFAVYDRIQTADTGTRTLSSYTRAAPGGAAPGAVR